MVRQLVVALSLFSSGAVAAQPALDEAAIPSPNGGSFCDTLPSACTCSEESSGFSFSCQRTLPWLPIPLPLEVAGRIWPCESRATVSIKRLPEAKCPTDASSDSCLTGTAVYGGHVDYGSCGSPSNGCSGLPPCEACWGWAEYSFDVSSQAVLPTPIMHMLGRGSVPNITLRASVSRNGFGLGIDACQHIYSPFQFCGRSVYTDLPAWIVPEESTFSFACEDEAHLV